MNSRRYWKNRIPFLLTNLVCMAALTVFLLVCGNSISAVLLILVVWAVVLLSGLFLTYWKRKRQMQKLLDIAGQLSERYLISEVMELPEQAEDQVYYQLLKMAGKSMLEQIGEVRRERLEYKEYIEQSPNGLDKGTASGTGKDQPFYRTGALLCPQRTHREGLFSPGNVLIPSGASGDCGQQIPAASEWGAAGSRGNGGYGLF